MVVTNVWESSYFEDFNVGDKFVFLGRTITDAENALLAGICGDFNRAKSMRKWPKDPFRRTSHLRPFDAVHRSGADDLIGVTQPTAIAMAGID